MGSKMALKQGKFMRGNCSLIYRLAAARGTCPSEGLEAQGPVAPMIVHGHTLFGGMSRNSGAYTTMARTLVVKRLSPHSTWHPTLPINTGVEPDLV